MPPYQSIPFRKYVRFLKSKRLVLQRTTSSHEIWNHPDKPFLRPLVIRRKDKDIPFLHIKTNCETMGITLERFYYEIGDC